MPDSVTRRDFLGTAALAAAGTALPESLHASPSAPWIRRRRAARFVAVSSTNGIRGVKVAVELMTRGTDTLDAGVEGVKIQELDPKDNSVGYGGLPNEEGVVQLDASCMHGPSKRAGAVACLEGIKTPSEVARLVLKYTNHILLVGEGAKRFALSYGFKEEDLLTQESREAWLRWRANRGARDDWVNVDEKTPPMARPTGTINMNLVNEKGEISSITDGGTYATGAEARGCVSCDAQAAGGDDPSASARPPRPPDLSDSVLCGQQVRRLRLRRAVPDPVRGLR